MSAPPTANREIMVAKTKIADPEITIASES
jgi:hypothetical protein